LDDSLRQFVDQKSLRLKDPPAKELQLTKERGAMESFLFTSESVTEGHPDKMADQISDAVLDAVLIDDPFGRVACETFLTTGLVVVGGEITTSAVIDIPRLVREKIVEIGYTHSDYGFDGHTCGVTLRSTGSRRTSHRAWTRRSRRSTT